MQVLLDMPPHHFGAGAQRCRHAYTHVKCSVATARSIELLDSWSHLRSLFAKIKNKFYSHDSEEITVIYNIVYFEVLFMIRHKHVRALDRYLSYFDFFCAYTTSLE